ncbi:MAG: hypothetical protein A2Y62_19480 [Candidatus Fischerbacteria bacterium RBG_13_37_8]|uniref:Uncharacterized protein n=1 Tax=Candidatus Fischerbacteria bacterium RBG_13_37_8 TaxID=1817863 RepID=A0A1F5VXS9_9BACT|nr:MAG: hypothetical protein A2Y62_19480 [Candidatus Fischerbacteria bacterium RBG_13_37_8]
MKDKAHFFLTGLLLIFAYLFITSGIIFALQETSSINYQERIACQKAIEQVYWNHQNWPPANNTTKPTFNAVMPEAVIKAKVEDMLKKNNALQYYWHQAITPEQLQAELVRMAQHTKKPKLLHELWRALNNEPALVAECLARPLLVDRLIRTRFAFDERFHGNLKQDILNEIKNIKSAEQLKNLSGIYSEVTWFKQTGEEKESPEEMPGKNQLLLSTDEWQDMLNDLSNQLGILGQEQHAEGNKTQNNASKQSSPEKLLMGRITNLQENAEYYFLRTVLKQTIDSITVASISWKKKSFDEWWQEEKQLFPTQINVPEFKYTLPEISEYACVNDSWSPVRDDLIERSDHTAVWTGTEMIVWGGKIPGTATAYTDTGGRYNPSTDTWTYLPLTNAPTARGFHTAVWTGSEMIIWGGYNGSAYFNNGARYNPSTNIWTPVSATSAPTIRGYHIAAWTGTYMMVWGGYSGSYLGTGGRYQPSTDQWFTVSATGAPTARRYHSAAWTSGEVIIWGGYSGSYLNTGSRYNATTDTWQPVTTTNAPTARERHTAIYSSTLSQMIVWGGYNGTYLNTGKYYDPATDAWGVDTSITNAPTGRRSHTAISTPDAMIIWGGFNPGYPQIGGVLSYATSAWTATSLTNAPSGRAYHTAVWTDIEMLVWGGYYGTYINNGGKYNPVSNSWTTIASNNTPLARYSHTTVWTGSDMIIWGGYNGASYFNTGARYNPATDNWTIISTTNAPTARYAHTANWTGIQMIVWGGNASGSYTNTGGLYAPSTDAWTATPTTNAPTGRIYHTSLWNGTGTLIWGGYDYLGEAQNTGGWLIASTWYATSLTNAPSARFNHTAVWTPSIGEMIVWGGNPDTNTGGRYVPSTGIWTATSTANAPTARQLHSAVWSGSEMIIWGGLSGSALNTGGKYNPTSNTWVPTSTISVPSARAYHAAIWATNEMIIWGGHSGSTYFNTGGRYNPSADTWTATSLTNSPTPRTYTPAVWTNEEMIVWGGYAGTYTYNTGGRYCVMTTTSNPPGAVPDNDNYPGSPLLITKSGTDLQLDWSAPPSPCLTSDYGIYRGTLPWIDYNHISVLCTTAGATTVTITADSGSYYYLIVAQNESQEGSYGVDSLDSQRPPAASPCYPLEIGSCN